MFFFDAAEIKKRKKEKERAFLSKIKNKKKNCKLFLFKWRERKLRILKENFRKDKKRLINTWKCI